MKEFTDEEMTELLPTARPYTIAILKAGPRFGTDSAADIIWEHGRRNFALRDDGILAIVLPVADGSQLCRVCVFAARRPTKPPQSWMPIRAWPPGYSPSKSTRAPDSRGIICRNGMTVGIRGRGSSVCGLS